MPKKYHETDLSDQEWKLIKPLIPQAKIGGRPRRTNIRKVINAISYILKTGCQWRNIPKYYPCWRTVYGYFKEWIELGVWDNIHDVLRDKCREQVGKKKIRLSDNSRGTNMLIFPVITHILRHPEIIFGRSVLY
ncbi:MAG: transposase [archaeon]|nr:transposase [archaeon]